MPRYQRRHRQPIVETEKNVYTTIINFMFKGTISVISSDLNCKLQCPIYNGTLRSFVWSS